MTHTIRRLNPGEADLYRQVRLESLRESPDAFATTYESAAGRTDESWVAQADGSAGGRDRATFVVLADGPLGLAALYRDGDSPDEGELLQVWVAPGFRGCGVAAALIDAVFAWAAANDFHTIRAEVAPDNPRALGFYVKQGFARVDGDFTPTRGNVVLRRSVPQRALG